VRDMAGFWWGWLVAGIDDEDGVLGSMGRPLQHLKEVEP
jgi:hypothetical protein